MSEQESITQTTKVEKSNENTEETIVMDDDSLKKSILKQVEFYFSVQNLPSDSFLLSKMDDEHYVEISLISTFGKIKSLTSDQNIIVNALKDSTLIEVSEDKTKIRLKEQRRRNRLILHNLPEITTDKDVIDIFENGNFKPSVKSDVNCCWFVTFETEQEATSGLEFIRQQEIHGKSVRARLKPEPLLRNIYNPPEPNPAQFLPQSSLPYNYSYRSNWNPMAPVFWDQNGEIYNKNEGKEGYRRGYKKQSRKDNRKGNKKRGNRKKGRDQRKHTPIQLGPSDFPPLPSASNTKNTGYSGEFKKYQPDTIVNFLNNINPTNVLPDGFPVLVDPITELEYANAKPIESKDLPVRTKPIPMAERVKKKAANKPNESKKKQDHKKFNKGKQANKKKSQKVENGSKDKQTKQTKTQEKQTKK